MGDNQVGQLGDGSLLNRLTPVYIATGVVSISCDFAHTLFVKEDGSVWATGNNGSGQLGDGSTSNRSSPVNISSDGVDVSAGAFHSHFIKSDGSLWGMGSNGDGQLGDSSTVSRRNPVLITSDVSSVSGGGEILQVSSGLDYRSHTLFVKTDGSLWAMGKNNDGQLGDGSTTQRNSPVRIATNVVSASAGGSHSLFLKADGSLWGMGKNNYGQLGFFGSSKSQSTPVKISDDVVSFSAGKSHSLFVKVDGSLWGTDGSGPTPKLAPIQLAAGVATASSGGYHSLFVKTDGSLWAIGNSERGQFGNGSIIGSATPVQVRSGVFSASAGDAHSLYLGSAHTVTFDLGIQGTRIGGGGLEQTLMNGTAAIAPTISVTPRWFFTGWDNAFSNVTSDLVVTAQYQTAFASWATSSGVPVAAAAPTADPDADGVANLLEYAFGSSPTLATPASVLPAVAPRTVGSDSFLVLTHRRRKATAVVTAYQQSTDLSNPAGWTPLDLAPVVTNPDADGDGLVELVEVAVPLPSGADPKLFLRLSVSE
jgi:alpha-tubulin suppressor-like RCC1 family protein